MNKPLSFQGVEIFFDPHPPAEDIERVWNELAKATPQTQMFFIAPWAYKIFKRQAKRFARRDRRRKHKRYAKRQ